MKRRLIVSILALLLVAPTAAATVDSPRITVYGTAEAMVSPDQLIWNVTVRNSGISLKEVAGRHGEITGDLLDFLKRSGLSEDRIQTSRMRFGENWQYRKGSRVKEGYFASTDIVFKLSDFEKVPYFWMKLSEIKHLSIQRTRYHLTNREKHLREVRRKALLAGREKAEDMAKTLGAKIGAPLVISEVPRAGMRPLETARALNASVSQEGAPAERGPGVAPGKIKIRVRLEMTFQLIHSEN